MALRESPPDGLKEGSVSLSAFRLGSRITVGRWRRGGEPEPNEESKRLRSDNQVTLKTFGLAGKTIETSREGSLESIGRVGGEKRSDRGLDDTDLVSFWRVATFSSCSRRLDSRYTLIRRFTIRPQSPRPSAGSIAAWRAIVAMPLRSVSFCRRSSSEVSSANANSGAGVGCSRVISS